jgi:hypothetical protein
VAEVITALLTLLYFVADLGLLGGRNICPKVTCINLFKETQQGSGLDALPQRNISATMGFSIPWHDLYT